MLSPLAPQFGAVLADLAAIATVDDLDIDREPVPKGNQHRPASPEALRSHQKQTPEIGVLRLFAPFAGELPGHGGALGSTVHPRVLRSSAATGAAGWLP